MEKVKLWKDRVERRLREIFDPEGPPVLREAMAYYLFQEGKRIRPLFTVAVSDALGGNEEDALTVGCLIEMIHNYSLIHDDLPAMDNDDLRRGLPTCHIKFGEAIAILAGDALLTYAFEVLSEGSKFFSLNEADLIEICRILAVKSGASGMVGGQVLDITGEGDPRKTSLMKTAALFEACFLCGGVVAGRKDILGDLEELGRNVGLLFQITDDILDKDGYFVVYGERGSLQHASDVYERTKKLVESLFGRKGEAVNYLVDLIYKRVT